MNSELQTFLEDLQKAFDSNTLVKATLGKGHRTCIHFLADQSLSNCILNFLLVYLLSYSTASRCACS